MRYIYDCLCRQSINGLSKKSLPVIRQRVTCVEVLVQELRGLRRVSSRCADLSVLPQQVLLQPCMTTRLPPQSGEQTPTAHGNMCRQKRGQFLLSVESGEDEFVLHVWYLLTGLNIILHS